MMRPKPCQKISLKLEPDGKAVGRTFARSGLHRTHFVRYSHQLLNVMAYFVCNHIGLSKVSRCTKPVLQLLIESQVNIDFFVPGTIKRSHCRPGNSARRLDLTPEKHQLRLPILRAHLAESVAPNILGIRQYDRDEPFELILFWSNWTGRWDTHFRVLLDLLQERLRISSQQQVDHHEGQPSKAAADSESSSGEATPVLDIVAFTLISPSHGFSFYSRPSFFPKGDHIIPRRD